MLSPIIISLLVLIAYVHYKQIIALRKYLYIGIWIIVAIVLLLNNAPFVAPFLKGYIGFAFLYIVMITGALDPKWKITARLNAVRAPYSIIGFVLLIVHPLNYASEVLSQTRGIPWYGLISFLIMIPLFITSYIVVRKKMKPKTWKQLQKFAYVSYGLILVHLIVQASSLQNLIVAILLFVLYGGLKYIKETNRYKKAV